MNENFWYGHVTRLQLVETYAIFTLVIVVFALLIATLADDFDELLDTVIRLNHAEHKRLACLEEIITIKTEDGTHGTD